MRASGIAYYAACTLQLNRKTRHGQRSKDFLIIDSGRESSSAYNKDTLWLISHDPAFNNGIGTAWLQNAVVRSCWHGPNQDGRCRFTCMDGHSMQMATRYFTPLAI